MFEYWIHIRFMGLTCFECLERRHGISLDPIHISKILAVGLSRIARGEVVSFCVPAVFWWLLYTFIIFGNSSCIIFAVVRSTLLLLHFYLHSLFFRSYLVSLQYFDDFCSYAALVHVSFLLLCAVLCCFWAFICILCAFVISLCAHSILMIFFISSNNSCSIFALCVVLCWFCTCVCACCFCSYLPCVPAIFWWLLSYSAIVHLSFLLLCAVLSLLLHFHLHSLSFHH